LPASAPPAHSALLGIAWHGRKLLLEEIARLPVERLVDALRAAFAGSRSQFLRLRSWGGGIDCGWRIPWVRCR
jgi:hypothetical protein